MPNSTFYMETTTGPVYPKRIIYLNVGRVDGGVPLNGVLFVVGLEALAAYDRREAVYDRVDITDSLLGVTVEGGRAYLYTAKSEHVVRRVESVTEAAIRRSYIKIVESGIGSLGSDFAVRYAASTDEVPENLVIDDFRS
jgi:hypothetical protein